MESEVAQAESFRPKASLTRNLMSLVPVPIWNKRTSIHRS